MIFKITFATKNYSLQGNMGYVSSCNKASMQDHNHNSDFECP